MENIMINMEGVKGFLLLIVSCGAIRVGEVFFRKQLFKSHVLWIKTILYSALGIWIGVYITINKLEEIDIVLGFTFLFCCIEGVTNLTDSMEAMRFGIKVQSRGSNDFVSPRVRESCIKDEKNIKSVKRIQDSSIVFENAEGMRNMYVDDRLEFGEQIVIYESDTAIENSITQYFSKNNVRNIQGLSVVGYLEIDYWDNEYIKIAKLYVAERHRRCGYATRMMQRLIEFAKLKGVKTIEVFASAGAGISQENLIMMYEKMGFQRKEESNNMIYNV